MKTLYIFGCFLLVTILAGTAQLLVGIPAIQTILTLMLLAIVILVIRVNELVREMTNKN